MESPNVFVLSELGGYWEILRSVLASARATGPCVHDARIAALCIQHGVDVLWTADRDFSRFADLNVANPLLRDHA